MSVYKIPPPEQEPNALLLSWRVFEVKSSNWPDTTRHLVGYAPGYGEGRVSSAATYLGMTAEGASFLTKSGRMYLLKGEPGYDKDAEYVWSIWKKGCRITEEKDVTNEYTPGAVVEEVVKLDTISRSVA